MARAQRQSAASKTRPPKETEEPRSWLLCDQCHGAVGIREGPHRDPATGDSITAYDCEVCGPLQREVTAGGVRYVPMPAEVLACTCKVCRAKQVPLEDGLCELCGWMVSLIRTRMEEVKNCKRKPPKRRPKCKDCGVPMEPVLSRADANWAFYCNNGLGCRWCSYCNKIHKFNELCPRPQSSLGTHTQ